MKKILVMAIALFAFLAPVLAAGAEDPQQEAKALVESAAAFLKANGKEATLAECNKAGGQFDKGDLYVFAYDMTATIVAHPKNQKLVGKNLMEVPDTDGKQFRKEIVETAKASGFGWVDYKYLNPESKKVEAKTTYLQKAGDIVLCCGTYK
jgi:cytochrome c